MRSKLSRSNCSLISAEANVYAVSKSPRRNASSCWIGGSMASLGAGLTCCAQLKVVETSVIRTARVTIARFTCIQPSPILSALASSQRLGSKCGPLPRGERDERSVHHRAAVDVERLARDVARFVGGEES